MGVVRVVRNRGELAGKSRKILARGLMSLYRGVIFRSQRKKLSERVEGNPQSVLRALSALFWGVVG